MTDRIQEPAATDVTPLLRHALKSQYHAELAMLREAIERCPEALWLDARPKTAFWQVAYHTLFFAHAYMGEGRSAFRPWAEHQSDVQHPDAIAGQVDAHSALPVLPSPYSREQALRYWAFVDGMVDAAVDALDLSRTESGFPSYPMPKLEHQLVNLRHIQHHTAQLADRLRAAEDHGVRWVGRGAAAPR
jgi:hypothetical protein